MNNTINYVVVPYKKLPEYTLKCLLESYISREGTDYGLNEFSINDKLSLAKKDLMDGSAIILWNIIDESFQILTPYQYNEILNGKK